VTLVLLVWALRSENTPSLELLVVGVVNRVDGGGNEANGEVVGVGCRWRRRVDRFTLGVAIVVALAYGSIS
jgi:hypothetical protein